MIWDQLKTLDVKNICNYSIVMAVEKMPVMRGENSKGELELKGELSELPSLAASKRAVPPWHNRIAKKS